MANSIKFEIKGLRRLEKEFANLQGRIAQGSSAFVFNVVSHAAERSAVNAPILTGDLRANMIGEVEGKAVFQDGSSGEAPKVSKDVDIINGKVINATPYAFATHEGIYGLGPISRIQPGTAEGGVGRKYIERVIQFHVKNYEKSLAVILKSWLPRGTGISGRIISS